MNRILTLIVAVAVLALLGFGVLVFTTAGPRPALGPLSGSDQQQAGQPGQPADAGAASAPSAEAAARFDAWAKPLRDAGLTIEARRIAERGETLGVAGLTIAGPDELPRWRWTVENASLFDREPFHLQAAGETTLTLTTAADAETSWTGRVDAFGIALQKDSRDVLSRSVIFRVNGLSLAGEGDTPLTLGDGQFRLFLGGGTGLLPPGTKSTLRLTDMVVPAAAGTALGSRVKSLTAEFTFNQKLAGYSYPEVLSLFESSQGIRLGTVGLDWGTLHFIGEGDLKVGRTGVLDGRFDVRIADFLTVLDAIVAAADAGAGDLASTYAAVLLEMGSASTPATLPFTITIKAGAIALEGASRGLADIDLGTAPRLITGAP